jgi:N-acetylneuraminic acid mutarotase
MILTSELKQLEGVVKGSVQWTVILQKPFVNWRQRLVDISWKQLPCATNRRTITRATVTRLINLIKVTLITYIYNYCNTQAVQLWNRLPSLKQNRTWTKNRVAALGNKIISAFCGGNDLYTLDLCREVWATQKGYHGPIWNISSYQNNYYVTAGTTDRKVYQLNWTVDSNTAVWEYITDMPYSLRDGGCFSAVASKEHIYMFGGLLNDQPLNTAIVYDLQSDNWLSLPNMPFNSYNCSSILIDNTLYVAGGRSKDSSGNAIVINEVISLSLNDRELGWKQHSVLEYGNATLTALHNKLIATGGISRDNSGECKDVNSVFVYDSQWQQWLPFPPMLLPHSRHGVCVTESNSLAIVGGQLNQSCELLTMQ